MNNHLENNASKVSTINKIDLFIKQNKIDESSFVKYVNCVGNYYHEQGSLQLRCHFLLGMRQ